MGFIENKIKVINDFSLTVYKNINCFNMIYKICIRY